MAFLAQLETIEFRVGDPSALSSVHTSLQSIDSSTHPYLRSILINTCWNAPWKEWQGVGHVVPQNFPTLELLHVHFFYGGSVDCNLVTTTFAGFQAKGLLLVTDVSGHRLN